MSLFDQQIPLKDTIKDYLVYALIFIVVFACVLCVSKIKARFRGIFVKKQAKIYAKREEENEDTDFI